MLIVEFLMLTVILLISAISTLTDFKTGLIKNKWIYTVLGISIVLSIVYYSFFAKDLILIYVVNVFASSVLSVLLYAFRFWGAGDSKLLIVETMLIPARLYVGSIIPIPTLLIIVLLFSIAFIYLIVEAIVLGIKKKDFFKISSKKITWTSILKIIYGYISSYAYIVLITALESYVFKNYMASGSYIFTLLNFFIILTIFGFDILRKWYIIIPVIIIDVIIILFNGGISFTSIISFKTILLVAIVMAFRAIAEKYNYKEIATDDIQEGQILSFETIARFQNSRVKGLPLYTTEDFRTKLNSEQVKSIKRWKNSKSGTETVIIVRKLPFAVFISIGTVAFLIFMRVWT